MGYPEFKDRTINRIPNFYRWLIVAALACLLLYSFAH